MIDKKNKIKNEAELLAQAERIKKANPAYIKAKKPYLNFVFSDGDIKIAPLQDVKDFLLEGQAMHHCVFNNEYYKEKDSLILSASKDNRRLETIEISISQLRVMQIRGACNQDSEYHSSIVKLTKSIIPAIEKISKEQKKKRIKEKV